MKDQFLADVARHRMEVLLDSGVHRHLKFAEPGTSVHSFHVVTFPGHLVFAGDMGSWVFVRLHDMFEFFRGHDPNPNYWSEKLDAVDRYGGFEEFDPKVFERAVKERLGDWVEGRPSDVVKRVREETADVLLHVDEHGEERLRSALDEICDARGEPVFRDFWEADCRSYAPRFLWACNAIPWAIAQYDAAEVDP